MGHQAQEAEARAKREAEGQTATEAAESGPSDEARAKTGKEHQAGTKAQAKRAETSQTATKKAGDSTAKGKEPKFQGSTHDPAKAKPMSAALKPAKAALVVRR